jgi:hypothetical protein
MKAELTQERLKELLEYNPDTGFFTWKESRGPIHAGDVAGYTSKHCGQYIKVMIDYVKHGAHRLAFLYMTGVIPDEIDHINRDGTDNRWLNLRGASRMTNSRNRGRGKRNKSGITGVHRDGASYRATIRANSKRLHLYQGDCKHDAILARYRAEVELGWHKDNNDTDAKRYVENLTVNQNVQP